MTSLTIAKTRIDGFTVTVERVLDRTGDWTDCYVSNGRDSGSLNCIENVGEFMNGDRAPPEGTLDRIRAWAEANGY